MAFAALSAPRPPNSNLTSPPLPHLVLLGPPGLVDPSGNPLPVPVGKPLALLAYLHLHDAPQPRAVLSHLLWPGGPPEKSRASLRQALWLLRKALGDHLFTSDDPVGLAPDRITSDLAAFRRLLDDSAPAEDLLELWRAPPFSQFLLPGLPDWDHWTESVRWASEEALTAALHAQASQSLSEGGSTRALFLLERATEIQAHRLECWLAFLEAALDTRDFGRAGEVLIGARAQFPDDERAAEALDRVEEQLRSIQRTPSESLPGASDLTLEFVGRIREYSELSGLWRQVQTGRARSSLILGEAGIGKSRLATQISLLARASGGRTVWVKAEEGESRLAWGFLTEMVRKMSRLSGAAGISPASERLLEVLVPGLRRNGNSGENGAHMPGAHPTLVPVSLAQALHDLIAAISDDGPLVLSLDDIQWIDAESCAVMVRLLEHLNREPILVLLTCRSAIQNPDTQKFVARLIRDRQTLSLPLAPLSREEVGEAVGLLAEYSDPDRADSVVTRLHEVSQGNPLFLTEVLRSLWGQGVVHLVNEEGWYLDVAAFPHDLGLPASVRALLRLRIRNLSPPAEVILREMLTGQRPLPAPILRDRTGLPETLFAVTVQDLSDRGVVQRTQRGWVAFLHDEMRSEVTDRLGLLPGGSTGLRNRWAAGVGGVLMASLAIGLLWAARPTAPPATPPFGGGHLLVATSEGVFQVTPSVNPPSEWDVAPHPAQSVLEGHAVVHPALGAGGEIRWFGVGMAPEESSWVLEILPDGQTRDVVRNPDDDWFGGLSPDGEWLLHTSDNPATEVYDLDLWIRRLDGSDPRMLLRDTSGISFPAFSRDGRRIAVLPRMWADSLLILTPNGGRASTLPVERAQQATWCGATEMLLVTRDQPSGLDLVLLDSSDGTLAPLPTVGTPLTWAACSPDGSMLVYQSIVDGVRSFMGMPLPQGESLRIPVEPGTGAARVYWLPSNPTPMPETLRTRLSSETLRQGESALMTIELVLSDGSVVPVEAELASSNPSVASITQDGRIYANHGGEAEVTAMWDGWLSTSTTVDVEPFSGPTDLLLDDFFHVDPARWLGVGYPTPVAQEIEDGPALFLQGDGNWRDGLLLADPVDLSTGATLEFAFRLPFTRLDRQEIEACFMDLELPPNAGTSGTPINLPDFHQLPLHQSICFRYPAGMLHGFNDQEVALANLFHTQRAELPGILPSDGWVQVALQMRSDGQASLAVNGQVVAEHPVRHRNDPDTPWRVGLFGRSVETEVHLRNLSLRRGIRNPN